MEETERSSGAVSSSGASGERTSDVGARVAELRDELLRRAAELREALNAHVQERPLTAVGIAFGVGYLLSGALVSRTTARVAMLGGRLVLGDALRRLVGDVGARWVSESFGTARASGSGSTHG